MMSTEALMEKVKEYITTSEEAKHSLELFLEGQSASRVDWWHDTPQAIKDLLEESRQQSARGEDISHEEMKSRYPQWFRR